MFWLSLSLMYYFFIFVHNPHKIFFIFFFCFPCSHWYFYELEPDFLQPKKDYRIKERVKKSTYFEEEKKVNAAVLMCYTGSIIDNSWTPFWLRFTLHVTRGSTTTNHGLTWFHYCTLPQYYNVFIMINFHSNVKVQVSLRRQKKKAQY